MTMLLRAPVRAVPSSSRILLVAGCRLLGETLQTALTSHGFDVVVSAGATGSDTLDEVQAQRPGVVVLDLDREGTGFGRDLIEPLIDLGATVFVLIGVADHLEIRGSWPRTTALMPVPASSPRIELSGGEAIAAPRRAPRRRRASRSQARPPRARSLGSPMAECRATISKEGR